MNEGQEEREFVWFPDVQLRGEVNPGCAQCGRSCLGTPGDTHTWDGPGHTVRAGVAQEQVDRLLPQRALKTRNKVKYGIKQKRPGIVLACLLASDF